VAAPAAAVEHVRNSALLIEDLKELHRRFQSGLKDCRLDRFITSHAAFGYLADRYGVRQVSITSGFSPEVEPAPRELARLADMIKEMGSRYVMVEPIISTRLAETLAREAGATLLTLHPLANLTVAEKERNETYFSLMDANLRSLRTALECA
jgi:zinc transport system substrate-binding protein